MATVNKLPMAIAGVVFSIFSFTLEAAHAHEGHIHSNSGQTQLPSGLPNPPSSVDPVLSSNSIFYGEQQPLGNGLIRSFITLDNSQNPLEIGVNFTKEALTNLPLESERYVYQFSLPKEAYNTAFNHIVMSWNPIGHQPEGVYDVPHFDVAFSTITPEERQLITRDDKALKLPAPEFIPQDYIPTRPGLGAVAPTLGLFMIDPTAPEFQGQPLTSTMLYTSYNGEIVLHDLTVSNAFLETEPNITKSLKLPEAYSKNAYYPTKHRVTYDPTTQQYTVALSGLTYRSATRVPEPSSTLGLGIFALGVCGAGYLLKRKKKQTALVGNLI